MECQQSHGPTAQSRVLLVLFTNLTANVPRMSGKISATPATKTSSPSYPAPIRPTKRRPTKGTGQVGPMRPEEIMFPPSSRPCSRRWDSPSLIPPTVVGRDRDRGRIGRIDTHFPAGRRIEGNHCEPVRGMRTKLLPSITDLPLAGEG